jgi:hypothetical protein
VLSTYYDLFYCRINLLFNTVLLGVVWCMFHLNPSLGRCYRVLVNALVAAISRRCALRAATRPRLRDALEAATVSPIFFRPSTFPCEVGVYIDVAKWTPERGERHWCHLVASSPWYHVDGTGSLPQVVLMVGVFP